MQYNDPIFYNALLILLFFLVMRLTPTTRGNQVIEVPSVLWVIPIVFFAVWAMASNPVVLGTWTDRAAYGSAVIHFQQFGYNWNDLSFKGEWLFNLYVYAVSLITDYKGFFYVTAAIYVLNYFEAAHRLTKEYAYVLFFSIIGNFQFYSYGQNTIRAGLAASMVTLGLTFCNKLWVMLLLFVLAYGVHHSMAITMVALLIAYGINKPKYFIWGWFGSILLSLVAGSAFEGFLSGFSVDDRTHYFSVDAAQTFYRVGFRWDFLAYSALPVALGYYYIYVLDFKSRFYHWVYCAYLIANSFWVLVIHAEFTDRFAYLSWFLFPIVLIYPLLIKQQFRDVEKHKNLLVLILMGQIAFNYYMFVVYNGFKLWY